MFWKYIISSGLLLWVPLLVLGQPTIDNDVRITLPLPVFTLTGDAEIIGTANAPGQQSYFIEYQPLANDLQPRDGAATLWLPATLPRTQPITDNVLGVWDTTTAPDGLYALRLTVNRAAGGPRYHTITPVRVDNSMQQTFAPFDEEQAINNALLALTATAAAGGGGGGTFATPSSSTTNATPAPLTGAVDSGVQAQVLVLSNLRRGDSTLFAIREGLPPGTELNVIGRSPRSNWLLVETPAGERGWVAPSVVQLRGSILDIPPVDPPTPPITPTPTATPIPPLPDAVITNVQVDRELKVGEAFQIIVEIRNAGPVYLPGATLFCNVEPVNVEVSWEMGNLQPGASQTIAIPLRLDDGGGGEVTIICRADMLDAIEEPNEQNNFGQVRVFLNE